jgi:LPS-assembly lipoprotein
LLEKVAITAKGVKHASVFARLFPASRVPRPASLVIATLGTMILSACGFQLRGPAVIPFDTIRVEAEGHSEIGQELERAIRASKKTEIVAPPKIADAVLKITGEGQEKYILALSSGGRVREFELRYRVFYRLTNAAGVDLTPAGDILLRRDMSYDDTQVLAKEAEEALLFKDMKSDAVRQIMRRLSAIKRSS